MDIIKCLQKYNPNVGWSVNADDYEQITCSDETIQKPSLAVLEGLWTEYLAAEEKKNNNQLFYSQISLLESKAIRPTREILNGQGDTPDIKTGITPRQYLAEYESQIAQLRTELIT